MFEFIHSTWREYKKELYYDAISGEQMVKELVEAKRKVGMETVMKGGVYEKVPIEERWGNAGRGPDGVKCVEADRGDEENPEYRYKLVAKEIKKDKHVFCGYLTVRGEEEVLHLGPAYLGRVWTLGT